MNERINAPTERPKFTFCAHFNRGECHSCQWIDLDYAHQIQQKEQRVLEAFHFFPPFQLEPSIRSPLQEFRNRAKMSVTGTVENPVIGLLGEKELDSGRELLSCPIHLNRLNEILRAIPQWIRDAQLIPYRIAERKGELKGLIAFYSPDSHQAYLRFILRSKECVSRIQKRVPAFQSQFPELVCITANIQPIPHAIQEGPEEIFLTERREIDLPLGSIPIKVSSRSASVAAGGRDLTSATEADRLLATPLDEGLTIKLAPQAFVQTNIRVATQLYETAAKWIQESQSTSVLELFCGQGAFSLVAAKSAQRFLGLEVNPEAVRSANETARHLGFSHLQFKALDAHQAGPEIRAFQPDLLLVNPPRRGLGKGVSLFKDALPQHLIYSSCSIDTLAADLKELSANYRLRRVQVFDLFPHTEHFEVLVWATKS